MVTMVAGIERKLSVVTLAAGLASGCTLFNGGSVVDRAAHEERMQCDAASSPDDLRVAQTARVLQVEGHYMADTSGIRKVIGARVVLRPPPGVSADRMTRILQCHNARVMLGRAGEVQWPDDPYVLPNTWVDIDVKEVEGNFVAAISADRISDNIRVLQRARAFAAAQAAGALPPKI